MQTFLYSRGLLIILLALSLGGCRPDGPEHHLTYSFLERIREASDRVNGRNQAIRNSMYYVVGSGGNRPEDLTVVQSGEELHQFSGRLRSQIDTLDELLAGEPPTAYLAESALVRVKKLSGSLSNFETRLSRLTKEKQSITLGLPVPDTLQPLEGYLREGSVAAARVALAQLRAEVAMAEYKALNHLASRVGPGCCFCFSRITPVAAAVSNTVKAGEEYQAQLFLGTDRRIGWYPRMASLNGEPIGSAGTFREALEVTLPPSRIPTTPGSQWQIALHVVGSYGEDTTLVIRRPYPVIVPVVSNRSPSTK